MAAKVLEQTVDGVVATIAEAQAIVLLVRLLVKVLNTVVILVTGGNRVVSDVIHFLAGHAEFVQVVERVLPDRRRDGIAPHEKASRLEQAVHLTRSVQRHGHNIVKRQVGDEQQCGQSSSLCPQKRTCSNTLRVS